MKTWYDVALERGAQEVDGAMSGAELERVGIHIINGCPGCGATVAPYNSYQVADDDPYAWCADCAGVDALEDEDDQPTWPSDDCHTFS